MCEKDKEHCGSCGSDFCATEEEQKLGKKFLKSLGENGEPGDKELSGAEQIASLFEDNSRDRQDCRSPAMEI